MPRFQITAPDGRVVTVEGETAPTEKDAADIFASLPAKNANFEPPRTLSNAADILQREKGTARAKTGIQAPKGSRETGLRDLPLQIQDIATEAIPATAGMLIGGPPLAAILGGMGNTAVQARRMAAGEQEGFKPGQALATSFTSAVGGPVSGTAERAILREGAKQGVVGLVGKTAETAIDEGRLPTAREAILATSIPAAGGALAQKVGTKGEDFLNPTERGTLEAAKKEGLKVIPSHATDSFLNKRLESIGGKAAVKQAIQAENVETVTGAAKKALGIPEKTQLSEDALAAIRKQESAPYNEIEAMSEAASAKLAQIRKNATDPHDLAIQLSQNEDAIIQAGADINKLREARNTARKEYAHYERQADPKALDRAREAESMADGLEDRIDEAAQRFGSPDLLDRLKNARTRIAKTWDVENALVAGNNEVSAGLLLRALKKGRPLSGELETIANFKSAFGESLGEPGRIPTAGVSALEPMAAGAAILANKPLAAGLPLLRGPARAILASRLYQALATAEPFAMPNLATAVGESAQATGQESTREGDKRKK